VNGHPPDDVGDRVGDLAGELGDVGGLGAYQREEGSDSRVISDRSDH
jgi:hypothetical protein